jgi:hypothetical protein
MTALPSAIDRSDSAWHLASIGTPPLLRVAETAPKPKMQHPQHEAKPQQNGAQKPNDSEKSQSPVSVEQALYLIRSTLLTLNDANRSGNYTVLRDLAAPGFEAKNTAADLGRIFADLRGRRVDLFATAIMAPRLTASPTIEKNGMLRLTGYFPTQPLRIAFDLLFQNVDHNWRLFGISVQTQAVAPQANIPPAAQKR